MKASRISYLIGLLIAGFLPGCSGESPEESIKRKVLEEAFSYASGNVKSGEADTAATGIISVGDDVKSFIINPSKLFIGLIDDDNRNDAVITIYSLENKIPGPTEHLVFLDSDNGFFLARAIESDMRILRLDERVLTAELPKYPRSSPLHNCADCQEIVGYRFLNGDLIRVDSIRP